MKKISLFWYPKFLLYISSYFAIEQVLKLLIYPERFKELSIAAMLTLVFALVKKSYMKSNIEIYARNLINSKQEVPKNPWVFSSILFLELLLTITLKLPILWMSFGWYLIVLPEHKKIYGLALSQRGSVPEEEKDLEKKTRLTLYILIGYVLFRCTKGFLRGLMNW